jgi:hypothetical protein
MRKQPLILLPHSVIVKAPGLLPMLYKPGEIARDLGIPPRTLYDWLGVGAPHQRDTSDHIWINGVEFCKWIDQNRKSKEGKRKLTSNEAFCLRCHTAVQLIAPVRKHMKGRLYLVKGKCPQCGITINRGDSNDRTRQLSQSQSTSSVSA